MLINLNGQPHEVPPGVTVAELIRRLGRDPDGRGVAVALEGEVVPRTRWARTELGEAATIEVVNAVGGG
jgi:sulfur carrier protein